MAAQLPNAPYKSNKSYYSNTGVMEGVITVKRQQRSAVGDPWPGTQQWRTDNGLQWIYLCAIWNIIDTITSRS